MERRVCPRYCRCLGSDASSIQSEEHLVRINVHLSTSYCTTEHSTDHRDSNRVEILRDPRTRSAGRGYKNRSSYSSVTTTTRRCNLCQFVPTQHHDGMCILVDEEQELCNSILELEKQVGQLVSRSDATVVSQVTENI
jgi:hypothetical protein